MAATETVEALQKMLEELRSELADLRSGIPFHVHTCLKGHTWRCTSPYCRAIAASCFEHGGGPLGQPPDYLVDPTFFRGGH